MDRVNLKVHKLRYLIDRMVGQSLKLYRHVGGTGVAAALVSLALVVSAANVRKILDITIFRGVLKRC